MSSARIVLCASLVISSPALATPRLLKPEDIAGMRDVAEPRLSPDGTLVVYTVTTPDPEKDKAVGNLWLASLDGSKNRALTFGTKGHAHPRWSPDGKSIAFLSARDDEHEADQLWVLPLAGGEAERLTDLKGGVDDFAWSPDSRRIALVVMDPDPRDPEKAEKEKKTVAPLVIDRFHFKQDKDGYLTARWSHLQLLDVATHKREVLTSGPHDELLPAWSPDGKQIAFVTRRGADPDRAENWDIWVIGAQAGAKERQVTTSPEADALPDWGSAPVWSPDGKSIAFLHGGDLKKIEYGVHTLAVIPAAGGEARVLTRELDRNVYLPAWSADGTTLLVLLEDDGATTLVRVPVGGGPPQAVVGGRRSITAYDASPNGRMVVLTSTADHPYEVFSADGGALRNLSRQNDAWLAQFKLGRLDDTSFKSKDGSEIHGFLLHPADAPARGKPPALLLLHGGPQGQYESHFDFEKQLFAAHGYTVIMPNPRGSTGRGEKFGLGIYAAWGGVDVDDDLAAVDDAVARGHADPERLGVGGWSYGGMATNYVIATTTRFKAAASGASISDAFAGYGTDQYTVDYEAELGTPWKNPDAYTRVSYPFLHADRIKTPTLFLCGARDFNVPLHNSEQMYQALRSLGVATELVIYPDQFHRLTKPSYILDRYRRDLDWYAKWGLGQSAGR